MTVVDTEYAADLLHPPPWQPEGRPEPLPHQIPPAGDDWLLWLLEAGRGAGKTEACARYFAGYMRRHPGSRGRIIAPTFGDAVRSCIEGPSGLLNVDPECEWYPTRAGGATVAWPNGSEALVLGTPTRKEVERLRAAGNRHIDWWEEMAANAQLEKAWEQAELGLRLGERPHSIASTTPRPRRAYKQIRQQPETVLTHARMEDNPHNPDSFRQRILSRYAGTRLGRQEIEGLLIDDNPRALVRRQWIEDNRVDQAPQPLLTNRCVGIDPGGDGNQALALVSTALDNFVYLERSERPDGSAVEFLRHAIRVAQGAGATLVVETNHGGTYLVELLGQVMREMGVIVGVQLVTASAGKQARAQPLALLIEQGKAKMVGSQPELEDELCSWEPDAGDESPHLLDAAVWASWLAMGGSTVGHEADLAAVPWK